MRCDGADLRNLRARLVLDLVELRKEHVVHLDLHGAERAEAPVWGTLY